MAAFSSRVGMGQDDDVMMVIDLSNLPVADEGTTTGSVKSTMAVAGGTSENPLIIEDNGVNHGETGNTIASATHDWTHTLSLGDMLNACDPSSKLWFQACIMEIKTMPSSSTSLPENNGSRSVLPSDMTIADSHDEYDPSCSTHNSSINNLSSLNINSNNNINHQMSTSPSTLSHIIITTSPKRLEEELYDDGEKTQNQNELNPRSKKSNNSSSNHNSESIIGI